MTARRSAVGGETARITDLPEVVSALDPARRARVERLFEIRRSVGTTVPPEAMDGWLEAHFGSVDAVRRQTIVRVVNRWSLEGTLFSSLRAQRPVEVTPDDARPEAGGTDPFCDPEEQTPAAGWGRVRGVHAITGANAAKYDAHHAVIVFDRHDPLAFDRETVVDLFDVGRRWAELARAEDPDATAYLLTWNCGWRAGASVRHGHAQALLGNGHYPRVLRLHRDVAAYRAATGGEYIADLVAAHRDLGLVIERGEVAVVAALNPIKERELIVVGAPGMDERGEAFAGVVGDVLVAFRDAVGVRSFNMALHRPPLFDRSDGDGWHDIGPMVHVVDRGSPDVRSSDIGSMELFAASVVSADPFVLAGQLREALPDRSR
jgi:galactose-1-phosphate uridylyltransferase